VAVAGGRLKDVLCSGPILRQAAGMRSRFLLISLVAAALAGGVLLWWQSRASPRLGEAAYAHTRAILAFGPRPAGSAGLTAVRGYLRTQLEAAGWVTAGQAFERSTSIGTVAFENVRARFPGGEGDVWQRPVRGLLGAHVDSKFYKNQTFLGADDAASACAAILIIARELATADPALARQLELVFFDGEEAFAPNITPFDGLYGSRFYANELRTAASKPQFGVILDMIGHRNLAIALPADTPEPLRAAVLEAAKKEGGASRFSMAPGPIIDDHTPLNLAGVPTVDIIGDFSVGGWWHTPADSLELISPESLDLSIRVALRVLRDQLQTAK
jgi:acetylornithine deacetylase/succinyl-diaminopimelate desuccinylase-like protein